MSRDSILSTTTYLKAFAEIEVKDSSKDFTINNFLSFNLIDPKSTHDAMFILSSR